MMCLCMKSFVCTALKALNVCVCFDKPHTNIEISRRAFSSPGENLPPTASVLSVFGAPEVNEFWKVTSLPRGWVPSLELPESSRRCS